MVGFQPALDAAASNPGADTVRLGINTYTGPNGGFGYSGNGPVAVIGSGQGQTTVSTPDLPVIPGFALNLTGPSGSSVSDLRLLIPTPGAGDPQRSGLGAGNNSVDAARVTVEAPAVFNGFGMIIQGRRLRHRLEDRASS